MKVPIPETDAADMTLMKRAARQGPLDQFEYALGGRDSLVDTLSALNLDKKQQHFLNLLSDPAKSHYTVGQIAKDAGVPPSAVIDLFKSAPFAIAYTIALGKMASSLPAVVEDMTSKAVDANVLCPDCLGTGEQTKGVLCPTCAGKKVVFRPSDLDRQKIILEATGVLKKTGGLNVNVNQQVGIMQPGTFFSKYVKASDDLAYSTEVIDAETTEDA